MVRRPTQTKRVAARLPTWIVRAMDARIEAGEFADRTDFVRHALRVYKVA